VLRGKTIVIEGAVLAAALCVLAGAVAGAVRLAGAGPHEGAPAGPKPRRHMDHSEFFDAEMTDGTQVTAKCLECHEGAAREVMATQHWTWLGDEVEGRDGKPVKIGKMNLLNNYCVSIAGNWAKCAQCHAGYGWKDASFSFDDPKTVDCLVCHDQSGTYKKGNAGVPAQEVDLNVAARSVGYPTRGNCGTCHYFGGGGLGVKHGDLDTSLDNPPESLDVHMGRGMQCIDCHSAGNHRIKGKAYSVSVNHENGFGCSDCHGEAPHGDKRLDGHTDRVACQTCHIPTYSRVVPTKSWWDWSKAGDMERKEDQHAYLKIKGEFKYVEDVAPQYGWFDLTVQRYLLGDAVAKEGRTRINSPNGSRDDAVSRIWPFKVNSGKQPYDTRLGYLLPPVTSGEGGYWSEFDWDKALRIGAKVAGIEYSGEYGFAETEMYWPLSHMVVSGDRALGCNDCHGGTRLDWTALGYDPDHMGADPTACGSCHESEEARE